MQLVKVKIKTKIKNSCVSTFSSNACYVFSVFKPVDSAKVDRGRQLDCFRELLENSPDTFDSVSQLLLRIANNIVQEPKESKYRTLKMSTNTFQNKLLPVKGAVECLFAMGFEDVSTKIIKLSV